LRMNSMVSLMMKPWLPNTFRNIITSMRKLIRAVLKKRAIEYLIAKLMLRRVSVEIRSRSQIWWMTVPIMNLLKETIDWVMRCN
jgi:hypothetical protein